MKNDIVYSINYTPPKALTKVCYVRLAIWLVLNAGKLKAFCKTTWPTAILILTNQYCPISHNPLD